jgi:hypothetical protein
VRENRMTQNVPTKLELLKEDFDYTP